MKSVVRIKRSYGWSDVDVCALDVLSARGVLRCFKVSCGDECLGLGLKLVFPAYWQQLKIECAPILYK